MSAAQPARGVAADLAAWVHDAGRAVGESTRGGRVLHGSDGEVETVVEDQAVRLGRRREGREHLGWVGGEDTKRDVQATEHRCRAHGRESCG